MSIFCIPSRYRMAAATLLALPILVTLPRNASAECQEFKIVEYEDRVEAVCVGVPLTEAQIKANQEEQVRQDREGHRKYVEEQNRQREAARAAKAQIDADVEAERKRRNQPPLTQRPTADPSKNSPFKQ